MKNHYRILMAVALMSAATAIHAQDVQPFEGEIFGGGTYPLASANEIPGVGSWESSNKIAYQLGVELRYNIKHSPLDVGLLIDLSAAHRKGQNFSWSSNGSGGLSGGYYDKTSSWRTTTIAAVCDYNYTENENTSFFAGAGVGYGQLDDGGNKDYYRMVLIPRVGVELYKTVRLTLNAHITRKYFNTVGVAVGFVIGGRAKK